MNGERLRFRVHDERLAIARLDARDGVPAWALGAFTCITRTPEELSVVCAQLHVPAGVRHDKDKIAFGIEGTIPMTTIGILAALCASLAAARVPVFAISTYDTDWLVVSADRFDAARAALAGAGHVVTGELPQR